MLVRVVSFALMVLASVLPQSVALATEQLAWPDLGIRIHPSEDPFYGLKLAHKRSLNTLLRVAKLRKQGTEVSDELRRQEAEAKRELSQAGLEAEQLLQQEARFRQKIKMQSTLLRTELDGRTIQIPGYLLPLDFEGTKGTEFLLVPYTGACIHTPPPPPNQIIHVTHKNGFSTSALFTPVWVKGKLQIKKSRQSVGLSDGTTDFDVGYALRAKDILPYE